MVWPTIQACTLDHGLPSLGHEPLYPTTQGVPPRATLPVGLSITYGTERAYVVGVQLQMGMGLD
jgi:hypothetical protein